MFVIGKVHFSMFVIGKFHFSMFMIEVRPLTNPAHTNAGSQTVGGKCQSPKGQLPAPKRTRPVPSAAQRTAKLVKEAFAESPNFHSAAHPSLAYPCGATNLRTRAVH
eukprot:1179298-Prorocentrum_minimum.AAC.8